MPVDSGVHTITMGDIKNKPLKGYSLTVSMVRASGEYNSHSYQVSAPNVSVASEIATKTASRQHSASGWRGFHISSVMDQGGAVE